MITVTRYHDISMAHRSVEDKGKCNNIHGHNYRIHFTFGCYNDTNVNRVIDFGEIKTLFCQWLETNWDHKLLISEHDPIASACLAQIEKVNIPKGEELERAITDSLSELIKLYRSSVVFFPKETSTENLARWLHQELGPHLLHAYNGVKLLEVKVEETAKCSATSFS